MIGIFDSGIGGLTVVKEFFKYLPSYRIIYFGDTARLPYGTKSPNFIKQCSKEIIEFLLKKGAKVIVIACHTSSSLATNFLKEQFKNVSIFEITTPGIKEAIEATKNKRIGVIGTPGTIKSGVHARKLLRIDPSLRIYSQSCPLLAPLVEEGWINREETKSIIRSYLMPLKKKKIDTLILACTHYPLLRKAITSFLGKDVAIINPASDLVTEFKRFLNENRKIANDLKKGGRHQFFVSDNPYNFKVMSRLCLNREIHPKVVSIN